MKPVRVRDYQAKMVDEVYETLVVPELVNLRSCVGSGKTVINLIVAMRLMQNGYIDRHLFLAPSLAIVKQTRMYSGRAIEAIGNLPKFWDRDDRLTDFLRDAEGHAYGTLDAAPFYATTYNAFRNSDAAKDWSRKLGDRLLITIDEGFHAPDGSDKDAPLIAQAVEGLRRVLRLGGTGRSDRQRIPGRLVSRSLAEHMLGGFTPHPLEAECLSVVGEETEDEEFFGIPKNYRAALGRVIEHHKKDGCPKALLRIKAGGRRATQADENLTHSTQADTEREEENLTRSICLAAREMLAARGLSYVDATDNSGNPDGGAKTLAEYLNKEVNHVLYDELEDFVILVRRGDEGVDFVSRSHIYIFGVPRSLELLEQIIGRVLRLCYDYDSKEPLFKGYPERWLTSAKVIFVVPENTSVQVSRVLLQSTAYISSMSSQISVIRELRIKDGFGGRPDPDPRDRFPVAPECVARVTVMWGLIVAMMASEPEVWGTRPITLAQKTQMTRDFARHMQTSGDKNDVLLANSLLGDAESSVRGAFGLMEAAKSAEHRERLVKHMNDKRREGRSFNDRLDAALIEVEPDFLQETQISEHLYYLTGSSIEKFGRRLIETVCNPNMPRSIEELRSRGERWCSLHDGRYPLLSDEDPDASPLTYNDYDVRVRQVGLGQHPKPLEGGLGSLFVRPDWRDRLHEIAEEIDGLRSGVDRLAGSSQGLRTLDGLRRRYQRVPEMVYFPHAWKACRDPQQFPETIVVAERLGRTM